ncbi:hypothetical protein D1BOALGB6SA_6928 [Olavius sp. associated proteobacterium Delta 1]|nr:hypothetical protein D1BOALGB6SA_6928 [Olavius sp. associated proteobacterium Delta 1]
MENLFEKGCLVQLSTSVWGATRKIKTSHLSRLFTSHEWLSANKKLVNPDALRPIKKVVSKARTYLAGVSLPFPLTGMVFMPKEMISKVDQKLTSFKSEFNGSVEEFMGNYDRLRETAMVCLGDLFNEMDYPVSVLSKFSFVWRFVILDVPNGNTAILAPEVYEREKEKFVQTMEQAREMAVESLREEFAGLVERITERFTDGPDGKPKVFKNSTVTNFYEYFETFKERNIFKDEQLAELVSRAQALLGSHSAAEIRSNDGLKDRIRSDMEAVETAMAEILARPRRKIILN